RIASATLSPRLRLAPFVELSSDLEAFRITLPLREQVFDGSVIRLRGRLSLNPSWSADVLLQHASTPSRSSGNLRVHYHVREGTSLWIALNQSVARAVAGVDGPLRVKDRTLVVKYIHTFGPS
ncbi:MAG TPA: hypothetical protein VMM79_15550, partial [Longimicrobiales bacterium]|nr:hypothetical protein [Longimicrobiales bacterium]